MNDLIDNTLHNIFIASFNYQSAEEGRTKHSISDDLNWYIWTGRATTAWIKALAKADPHKLLERIVKSCEATEDGQTTDNHIRATTAYLKRYCGLQA